MPREKNRGGSEEEVRFTLTLQRPAGEDEVRRIEEDLSAELGARVECRPEEGEYPSQRLVCRVRFE